MTSGRCKKTIFSITSILMLATLFSADTTSATPATELNIDVLPVLSVSMSDISLHAEVNVLTTGASTLTIGSNNATGYNTFISSTSSETALIDSSEEYQIPALSSSTTLANFPTNAWGISMDGTNYAGIAPLNNSLTAVASLSPSSASTSIQDFHFAAKVDSTTPAGLYSNAILITVVPNYTPITLAESYNLAGKTRIFGNDGHKYYSMQDMNPTICNTADKEHSSIQVVDERDNKVYWITKLKDGNCWMTQNLDFDIAEDNVTPELSDVEVAWNSSSAYPPQTTSTTIFNNSDYTGTYSYDPGDKYLPSGTGTATDIDCSIAENKENCHYHVGNYYQWNAATAGTSEATSGVDASSSICPKNWRLPTSNSYTDDYSFGNLTNTYGITNNADGTSDSALIAAPLYFIRGGFSSSSSIIDLGDAGLYWSSTINYPVMSYLFYFESSIVLPSNYYDRHVGYNVRCVARGNSLTLSFDANNGTSAPASILVEGKNSSMEVTIPATIPTRSGYNFLGWANSNTAATPDYIYNNGTFTPATVTISTDKTLYAVWEVRNYTITWNANGGNFAVGVGNPYILTKEYGSFFAIGSIPIPTYSGYNFQGWFTDPTSGTQITGANNKVTGNATYYAHWAVADITGLTYMQDITPTACANTPIQTQKQLIDSRDNKLYWVAKLADGNCWMTQNLDYDIKAGDNIVSNLDGTTGTWSPNTATTTSVFDSTSNTDTYSYNPGSNYIPNGTGTPVAIICTSTSNGGENCHYHQGNYYQWNAATAGTGGTITSTDATSSICPKGWRLPTSNSADANYSFGNLVKQYGYSGGNQSASDSTLLVSPLFFARGGYVNSGSLSDQGSGGYYWSSRAYVLNNRVYFLKFNSSSVYSGDRYSRNYGLNVRCVAL